MSEPLDQLDYFTEWGGKQWETLVRRAVRYMSQDGRLDGLRLLDIGARYGKMSLLFAMLGADVTGIDIQGPALGIARRDTQEWLALHEAERRQGAPGVLDFAVYDGSLDVFADESFDVIFTKSVLVVVPELEPFLQQVARKLKPGGKIVFIENARGNPLLHSLRALRHRRWNYRRAHFFTQQDVKLIRSLFDIEAVHTTALPPIYLFLGKKRA